MKFSNNLLVTVPMFREFYPWEVSLLKKKSKMSELLDELPCHLQRTNISLSSLPPPSLSFSSLHLLAYQQNAHLFVLIGYRCTCNCREFPYCKWYQSPQRGSLPLVFKVNLGICILLKGLKWFWSEDTSTTICKHSHLYNWAHICVFCTARFLVDIAMFLVVQHVIVYFYTR